MRDDQVVGTTAAGEKVIVRSVRGIRQPTMHYVRVGDKTVDRYIKKSNALKVARNLVEKKNEHS